MLACMPPMSRMLKDMRHCQTPEFHLATSTAGQQQPTPKPGRNGTLFRRPALPAGGSARRACSPSPLAADMPPPCRLASTSERQRRGRGRPRLNTPLRLRRQHDDGRRVGACHARVKRMLAAAAQHHVLRGPRRARAVWELHASRAARYDAHGSLQCCDKRRRALSDAHVLHVKCTHE
jgi:hypothetical protein